MRSAALALRPSLANVGWPPGPPPRDDPHEALDEALALAAYNGRLEMMEWLLSRGARVDGTTQLGMTARQLAGLAERSEVVRWLDDRGAARG